MKPDYILKADVLDIIFEKRNKDYGAYALRKYYNERLYKSLAVTFVLILATSLIIIFHKRQIILNASVDETKYSKVFTIPQEIPLPPPAQIPKPLPGPNTSTAVLQKPVLINTSSGKLVFSTDAEKITDPDNDQPNTSPFTTSSGQSGFVPYTPTPVKEVGMPLTDKNIPLEHADIMPAFPGGMDALKKFLERNLIAPKENDISETVIVKIKFIVGYDGRLKGFEILKDGGTIFNNEVMRVLKKMPAWIPGKAHGENVSVFYTIPVEFTPSD